MAPPADENKDKPSKTLSGKFFEGTSRIIDFIVHNPSITLAVGLILGGVGSIYNPLQKWLEVEKRAWFPRTIASNWSSVLFGSYIAGITGIQLQNIFQVYRYAVGAELNKRYEEVTPIDMLFRTKNTVVHDTKRQFAYRIPGRLGATLLAAALPYLLLGKKARPHPSIMSGATTIETELENYTPIVWDMLADILEKKAGDSTTADEIKNILVAHRTSVYRKSKTPYHPPALGTEEAKNEEILTSFIARLLTENREERLVGGIVSTDRLKEATLIYLMGNEAEGTGQSFLDQPFPINLAYVALARKDDERLRKVKEAANAIAHKENPESVFHRYGIDMHKLAKSEEIEPRTSHITNIQSPERDNLTTTPQSQKKQLSYAQKASIKSAIPSQLAI